MLNVLSRIGLGVALFAVAACDQVRMGPQTVASSPAAAPAPVVDPGLRNHAGETYAAFVADAGAAYGPDALGLNVTDRTRLWRAMAAPEQSRLLTGGGAEALVFHGCAETGCADGAAVVALDTATGAVFAGVRDVGGDEVLAPNDRLEALLRLNTTTRGWLGAPAPAEPAAAAEQP